ncbi:hypothetical protein ACB094_12G042500 [Castanea mollissima]
MALEVLEALDTARTQYYHVKAIIIAGMGFFTDAYDLFCISAVAKLLGRLYYYDPCTGKPRKLPVNVNNAVTGVALVGTLCGQLVFGYLGDKLGSKKVYGITLILLVICAICSGLSFCATSKSVIGTLCFFRFWLGFGIGGDYPLSATIMSEYSNKKTHGAFIAAVFAMQGLGIIFAGLVSMVLSAIFLRVYKAPASNVDSVFSTQPEADYLWRIVLMLGALPRESAILLYPAILTYYWRMKMPEIGRYTVIIEGNAKQAAADMGKVLDIELQKDIFPAMKLTEAAGAVNALTEVYETSRAMFVVALLGTFPGYWFTVFFIERLGRFIIQLIGFFMMPVFMFALAIKYEYFKAHVPLFALLYGLTFFFANFGPNSTTFVLPAELFPTRVRSTCHAMSVAAGKAGAMVGAFGVQSYTLSGETGKIRKAMMILAVTNMFGFCFTFLVPETMRRSLEEISGKDERGNEATQGSVKPPSVTRTAPAGTNYEESM